jgi:hypothetical protein
VSSPSRNIKFATVGIALIAAVGLSFFGGMAYQNGVDQPLIGQYAPSTSNAGLARTRGGAGSTGSATNSGAASASGATTQP